jgi:hypothetical protein
MLLTSKQHGQPFHRLLHNLLGHRSQSETKWLLRHWAKWAV